MKSNINIGFIGLGGRGRGMLKNLIQIEGVHVAALCEIKPDRLELGRVVMEEAEKPAPKLFSSHRELLKEDLDAVVICTTWITHIPIAVDAMRAGKHVAMEVGGAASEGECWNLVRTSEETGKFCMLLENCCYADNELMVFNMVQKGLFGELIHAAGGYEHDLRQEIVLGRENQHGRLANFLNRNGELYPTHQFGPIAKTLQINRGNRIVSLVSMASKARGLRLWAEETQGSDYDLSDAHFNQGDVVTTILKCAGGETIVLTHNCSLPRPYSRDGRIQGTRGLWLEDKNSIYLEERATNPEEAEKHEWTPIEEYRAEHRHPLWVEYEKAGLKTGHGGIDYLVLCAFVESVKLDAAPSIDVYDAAVWMAITYLSEQSVAMGGMPVSMPDFTSGKWIDREEERPSKYMLSAVKEEVFA